MSNYYEKAIHPKTGIEETAEYLDDYFGHHQYGIRFSDGQVFTLAEIKKAKGEFNLKEKTNG